MTDVTPLLLIGSNLAWCYRRGGSAWTWLSWIRGLERLGVAIFVVDQLDLRQCVVEPRLERSYANALNLAWFDSLVSQSGLAGRAALVGEHGEVLRGPGLEELVELAESADALINLAGALRVGEIKNRVRRRVAVDIDPGLTHFWLAAGRPVPRMEDHDVYFTIGENVGRAGCPIPTAGITWRHTRQPVLLDDWPVHEPDGPFRFTTVAGWRGPGPHGRISLIGLSYGDKADEFLRFRELPRLSGEQFELAVGRQSDPQDLEQLVRAGWRVTDAAVEAGDPDSFRRYVQGSGAEFSVAKAIYVETRSGWFSDRTTRYLASGRPALIQNTGLTGNLPVGDGVVTFRTVEEAVTGARMIASNLSHHAIAARQLAEEHFAAEVVLPRFLDEALSARR